MAAGAEGVFFRLRGNRNGGRRAGSRGRSEDESARDKIGSRVEREGHDIIGREGIREMASESHTIRAYTAATNEDTFSTQYAVRSERID